MAAQEMDRSLAILGVVEDLARAATPAAAYAALAARLPRLVQADGAAVFERRQQTREHWAFLPVPDAAHGTARFFTAAWPITTSGRLRAEDAPPDSPYATLFEACGSPAALVYTPIGEHAVLVLTFDAAARTLTDAEWRIVQGIAATATAAVERAAALQRLHDLTLEDPATGLGSRRLVEVLLQHNFAQATRGEPLSVVGIRPVSRPATPPRRETPAADVQRRIANLLREHARAADTVARLDDDIFVIVLRAASSAGAEAFLRRVLDGAGDAALNCVVTEYDSRFESPQAMLTDVVNRVQMVQAG
jgi:hypothetical protein